MKLSRAPNTEWGGFRVEMPKQETPFVSDKVPMCLADRKLLLGGAQRLKVLFLRTALLHPKANARYTTVTICCLESWPAVGHAAKAF
ncbi:hypothetical protein NDU88_004735 [Pleurodeles waltl]|uniref:Uncharacterized protein n=1 Tax=Pleurodeles waltl TaxID=8319 RepID=A0AAV7M762_PLEWA|nr:hypothetical protein NDU88_004735 [Pleurodeles waltl]